MYSLGLRYWNVPVLVNTGKFLEYKYSLKFHLFRNTYVIEKLTMLECKKYDAALQKGLPWWSKLWFFYLFFFIYLIFFFIDVVGLFQV